jgi:hypothetical protein
MSPARTMKTIFMRRNSSKLMAALVTLCCLLFVFLMRKYKADLTAKSYFPDGGTAPLSDDELPTCTSFSLGQVLITTPNKVFLYGLRSQKELTIHSGHGLYYGSFRGPDNIHTDGSCSPTLFINVRPQDSNGNDQESGDKIIQIDIKTQEILKVIPIPFSTFSHDMIKHGSSLYIADTANGNVHELSYPSFSKMRTYDAFSGKDHMNNLAFNNDKLYVMLHSRGASALSVVDPTTGTAILYKGVGSQAHHAMQLPGNQVLYLDSGHVSLKLLLWDTMSIYNLYTVKDITAKFLKGLLVKDNVAYFGSTIAGSRKWRRDFQNDAEIFAFDLIKLKLISRDPVDSDGLTNMITQPFVSDDTGYIALDTAEVKPPASMLEKKLKTSSAETRLQVKPFAQPENDPLKQILAMDNNMPPIETLKLHPDEPIENAVAAPVAADVADKEPVNYHAAEKLNYNAIPEITPENIIGGHWPSGLKFMDLGWKNVKSDLQSKVNRYEDVQLIMGDIGDAYLPLKKKLLELEAEDWEYARQNGNAFLSERDGVMNKFKPGVRDIKFAFSDIKAEDSYIFPFFFKYEKELTLILDRVLGPNMTHHIGRMQLARMADKAQIKKHVDSGGWPSALHRIHVPIILSRGTKFYVVGDQGESHPFLIHLEEGQVFEINNRVPHWVDNTQEQRVHLVIDVRERPYTNQHFFVPGQTCRYLQQIICEEQPVSKQEAAAAWKKLNI